MINLKKTTKEQVLNNLLLEFTVTTGIFGSETYVFVDGLWHQKGELFPFNTGIPWRSSSYDTRRRLRESSTRPEENAL